MNIKSLHWYTTIDERGTYLQRDVECFIDADKGMFMGHGSCKREAIVDAVRGINEWKEKVNAAKDFHAMAS